MTVVFVDLRGFTAFAETAEPEEVMGVLREYHAAMGRLILEHEGTLERFTGDGMMIFFNDPVEVPNPSERAIRMAIAMRDRRAGLAARWRKHGWDLALGVGIAQGYATIGAIGFEGRLDYGAIGTVTNLAARLCGEAGAGQILISARVAAAVEAMIEAEDMGPLALKGLARPVPIWSVRRSVARRVRPRHRSSLAREGYFVLAMKACPSPKFHPPDLAAIRRPWAGSASCDETALPAWRRSCQLGPVLARNGGAANAGPSSGVTMHEGLPPPGPDPGQPDPEEPVRRTKLGPHHRPLVDGELVAQGQVLEGELAVAAEEEGEEPKQVEQESDHRAEIVSGSGPPDQPLGRGCGFGDGQHKQVERSKHKLALRRSGLTSQFRNCLSAWHEHSTSCHNRGSEQVPSGQIGRTGRVG